MMRRELREGLRGAGIGGEIYIKKIIHFFSLLSHPLSF
jgi:hypothetical protein